MHPCISVLVAVSIIALLLSLESYIPFSGSTLIEAMPTLLENAPSPIWVTLEGMQTA